MIELHPNTLFAEFSEQVLEHLGATAHQKAYRMEVGRVLQNYVAKIGIDTPTNPDIDPFVAWINPAFIGANMKRYDTSKFHSKIPNELKLGRPATKHAIAAHYRMHMHILLKDLSFAQELDNYVTLGAGNLFKEPLFLSIESPKSRIKSNEFVTIREAGWTQMPQGSLDYELAARVTYKVLERRFEGRDFQYGLRQSMMRVIPQNFEILREYCSFIDRLPGSYKNIGDCEWLTTEPLDNFGTIRGTAVSGPICVLRPISESLASANIEIYARSSAFELSITDVSSGNKIFSEDSEKALLIERIYGVYIKKLACMDEEHILLSSKSVTT